MGKLWCRHEMLVMVSGGSGITPFISVIRTLLLRANTQGSKVPRVLLICAFKKSLDLTMLDLLLPASGINFNISILQLQIEAYVTREKEPEKDDKKLLQTIRFKPNAVDEPVSAVLGQNSWLYLGIIISSSFMLFLLLIAVLTRYYIYPIDHNSDMIYPYFGRASLNMLLVCVSIAITATSGFLWNKKQNKDLRQIQNMCTPSPVISPNSGYYTSEKELESLPLQSFVQATTVHYGERPNLQSKIILSFFFFPLFFAGISWTWVQSSQINIFSAKWFQSSSKGSILNAIIWLLTGESTFFVLSVWFEFQFRP